MSEISFNYTGNPPEQFKKVLFDMVRIGMADIKSEVLANKGFIRLDYNNNNDIDIRVACDNSEVRVKMHVRLQALLQSKKILSN
jgi:hypothetical protein